ncbi:hypothetical protein L6452_06683 [Arctium lappa]|uniref:Uncharacterized protein n=1 Tax=Arctium lappa TaxID=4217 RepID=A0ACB9EKL2_ARCLA|nr:hypothetical protein L6452_06683 [Arctium lappa]
MEIDKCKLYIMILFRYRSKQKVSVRSTSKCCCFLCRNLKLQQKVVEVHVKIIGPSDSGKSMMLRALNRLLEPPSDTVFLDGTDISGHDVLELCRKVGMLFQLPVLFQGTVADNISYGEQ